MKVGTIPAQMLQNNLTAHFYLDRCRHCGRSESQHVNGRCGAFQRVYVESGTHFENLAEEVEDEAQAIQGEGH